MIIFEVRSPYDAGETVLSREVASLPPVGVGHQINLIAEFREYDEPAFIDNIEWRLWEEHGKSRIKCIIYTSFVEKAKRRRLIG